MKNVDNSKNIEILHTHTHTGILVNKKIKIKYVLRRKYRIELIVRLIVTLTISIICCCLFIV